MKKKTPAAYQRSVSDYFYFLNCFLIFDYLFCPAPFFDYLFYYLARRRRTFGKSRENSEAKAYVYVYAFNICLWCFSFFLTTRGNIQ